MTNDVPPLEGKPAHDWDELVKRGVELPGLDGCYWRLLAKLNVEDVSRWVIGEDLRGMPLKDMMDAIEMWVASAVTQVAGRAGRAHMQEAAAHILRGVARIVHHDVMTATQKSEEILRRNLKVVN